MTTGTPSLNLGVRTTSDTPLPFVNIIIQATTTILLPEGGSYVVHSFILRNMRDSKMLVSRSLCGRPCHAEKQLFQVFLNQTNNNLQTTKNNLL